MRRSTLIRFLAIVLVISMLAAPISAAGLGTAANESNEWGGLIGIIIEIIRNIFDSWFQQDEPAEPADPVTSTEPDGTSTSTEAGAAAPAETVPGEPVAENPVYEQTQTGGSQNADVDLSATGNAPVTMGNVTMGLNALGTVSNVDTTATAETTVSETPLEITTDDLGAVIPNGKYVIRYNHDSYGSYMTNNTSSGYPWNTTFLLGTTDKAAATHFTFTRQNDGTYTIQGPAGNYVNINAQNAGNIVTAPNYFTVVVKDDGIWLMDTDSKLYINALGANHYSEKYYGGYSKGSPLELYAVTTSEPEVPEQPEEPEEPAVNPDDSSRDIPTGFMTVEAGNFQPGNDPDYVLDNDANTIWHTVYRDSDREEHWIEFKLSEEYTVDGLRYLPRKNGENGIIMDYEILVSDDGETFTPVASGTWDSDNKWKIAQFEGQNVKYVRLKTVSADSDNGNKYASAAEIRLTGVAKPVTVVYFPVTMYNYDGATINAATDKLDNDLTVREGFYFSDGGQEMNNVQRTEEKSITDLSAFVAGQYYIQNVRASENGAPSWLQAYQANGDNKIFGVDRDSATIWTLVIEDGTYYLTCEINGKLNYMNVGTGGDDEGYTTEKTSITLSGVSGNTNAVKIGHDHYYLCQWNSSTAQDYGGYGDNADDPGNAMLFYPVDSATPIAPGETVVKIISGYERWNWWNKFDDKPNGDLIYTGLVKKALEDDQIVFNILEGGVFNDDKTVKNIYEFVGMPFEVRKYTEEHNAGKLGVYYSFDSDRNGVYFEDAPESGTGAGEDEMHKLHFAQFAPQPMPKGVSVGDHSTNAFLPFNNSWTVLDNGRGQYSSEVDYHFGIRADLPFAMTPNGRIKSTDDESAPITFTFSGDDDVWVFIDGHLVIDLGGLHNRLDATINFAENTITYSEENGQDEDHNTGSYNDPNFDTTQYLFTANGVEGVIPTSREAFAMDADHELQVFYLERGKGTSNCRIEFNLPMNDTVIVTKEATKSWSKAAEDADLAVNPDDDMAGIEPLTKSEQAVVDNIDFGFTLYKKEAGKDEFTPVANTNYYLIGRGVEGTVIPHTDANGHFYLKNGQSAKFITDLSDKGVTYYVVEDQVPNGFVAPDFKFAGNAAHDFEWYDALVTKKSGTAPAEDASKIGEQIITMPVKGEDGKWTDWKINKSYEVTVKGAVERKDSIEFKCINFFDATLPNPTAIANEDIIVIDYGLPVQIDPLANDSIRGDNVEIVFFGTDGVTLTETRGEDNIVRGEWSGDQKFHSGSVVLNDVTYAANGDNVTRDTFTYTLNQQLTKVEVITYIIKVTGQEIRVIDEATGETRTYTQNDFAIGKIYIVPATVMYYEENFSNLVTFTNNTKEGYINKWDETATTTDGFSDYQEPGVVGTIGDSVYGSDAAYVNDSFDSNGTSRHADTTNGALAFSYTFTGTGTTIFGRTSADTGYIQVKIYELNGNEEKLLGIYYRDTYWKDKNGSKLDSDGILYNIPLYTNEGLDYGTYKVVCTIAKAGTPTANYEVDENGDPKLDENGKYIPLGSGKDFYLDGIRIMQPLNESYNEELVEKALGAYATDGESNIKTITLRYKLISDNITGDSPWNFAVLTDIDGEVVMAEDYISIGPKEEVYLLPGQSVSFSVKYWHKDGYQMHMGMKAPFGDASVKVGQTTFDLKNAADCYFDITDVQVSSVTKYEQATYGNGYLLYTDEDDNQVYEDDNGEFFYVETGDPVSEDAVLTPVDDLNLPYFVATYTFTATDKIVSLTNIKAVGNYSFILYENIDENVDGPDGGNEDYESEEGNE